MVGPLQDHLETPDLFQGDNSCRLFNQAPKSKKHILLEGEALDLKRRMKKDIRGQTISEDVDLGLGDTILKFSGVGKPLPGFKEHINHSRMTCMEPSLELLPNLN